MQASLCFQTYLNNYYSWKEHKNLLLRSLIKNERRQVNEKFYKLERVYRDCIKITRDKTRIYSILHDAPGA